MRLRIMGRHDSLLLAGFAFALLVIFQRSIQFGLEIADEIQQTYGVALLPALVILTVMFVFHVHASRREHRAEAAAAATEAALLRDRADELESLMLFGQALAQSLSVEALRETTWRYLPNLTGGSDVWVVLRSELGCERLIDVSGSRWPFGDLEQITDAVLAQPEGRLSNSDGIEHEGHTCFPMLVGGEPVGVTGVASLRCSLDLRRKVGAAAALLTVAVRNAQLFAEIRDNSIKDALTGCYNRAHALDAISSELARSRRTRSPLSAVLLDIDNFKEINDRFGHLTGDAVLAAVGNRIRQILRCSDTRCRYGGDEFLIVLPETSAPGASRVAEWLRAEIEQIEVAPAGERVRVTTSAGVATAIGGDLTPEALIERADRALYQAKAAGRNCVRMMPRTPRAFVPATIEEAAVSAESAAAEDAVRLTLRA